jgi:Tfp pilus assembly protein PilO
MTEPGVAFLHVVRHPLVIAALFALCAALGVLGAVAAAIWEPAHQEARAAEAALEKASAELRELQYRVRLAQDYAARQQEVETAERKLLQAKPEPEFVRDVEALVAKTGTAATQFSSHSIEQSNGFNTAYFEFLLTGPYASLRRFIAELPALNEFVSIERVSLERNGQSVRALLVLKRHQKAG